MRRGAGRLDGAHRGGAGVQGDDWAGRAIDDRTLIRQEPRRDVDVHQRERARAAAELAHRGEGPRERIDRSERRPLLRGCDVPHRRQQPVVTRTRGRRPHALELAADRDSKVRHLLMRESRQRQTTAASSASIVAPSTRSGLISIECECGPSRSASRANATIVRTSRSMSAAGDPRAPSQQRAAAKLVEHLADVVLADRQEAQARVVGDVHPDAAEADGERRPHCGSRTTPTINSNPPPRIGATSAPSTCAPPAEPAAVTRSNASRTPSSVREPERDAADVASCGGSPARRP